MALERNWSFYFVSDETYHRPSTVKMREHIRHVGEDEGKIIRGKICLEGFLKIKGRQISGQTITEGTAKGAENE